jgi:hypothetical protein
MRRLGDVFSMFVLLFHSIGVVVVFWSAYFWFGDLHGSFILGVYFSESSGRDSKMDGKPLLGLLSLMKLFKTPQQLFLISQLPHTQ